MQELAALGAVGPCVRLILTARRGRRVAARRDMSKSLICARAFEFADRILSLCDACLWKRGPGAHHIALQLIQSGTSIGANAEEAQEAQTKPDFIARMSISRKEARESNWWLRLALKRQYVTESEAEWALRESLELLAMIRSAIRTARSRPDRG